MYIFWDKNQKYNFKNPLVLDQYTSKTSAYNVFGFCFELMATVDAYLYD